MCPIGGAPQGVGVQHIGLCEFDQRVRSPRAEAQPVDPAGHGPDTTPGAQKLRHEAPADISCRPGDEDQAFAHAFSLQIAASSAAANVTHPR